MKNETESLIQTLGTLMIQLQKDWNKLAKSKEFGCYFSAKRHKQNGNKINVRLLTGKLYILVLLCQLLDFFSVLSFSCRFYCKVYFWRPILCY